VEDEAICCSLVTQTYAEIEKALQQVGQVREIHIFAAVPQSYMMVLGREFKGMPPTVHYEWSGDNYVRACACPAES
jgi:SMODS-associated and fused to various effectors sensor domain